MDTVEGSPLLRQLQYAGEDEGREYTRCVQILHNMSTLFSGMAIVETEIANNEKPLNVSDIPAEMLLSH